MKYFPVDCRGIRLGSEEEVHEESNAPAHFLKGKCVLVRVEIIHMLKFRWGTVEKNYSTIGPPAGIQSITPLRCQCDALTTIH